MGRSIVARNYAETLLSLAERHGGESAIAEYGTAISEVAVVLREEPLIREFLETPKVSPEAKKNALEASFKGRVPEMMMRFLLIVVEKRRQALLTDIAEQYHLLVDETRGRLRAHVTLARAADDKLKSDIVSSLEKRYDKTIIADYEVDPDLVGGIVIRVGDEILDGSLGRRVAGLRRRIMEVRLNSATSATGNAAPA